jgi:hypothetical protein
MKNETKKTEAAKAPAPTLANLFNYPMTAVMRALGKAQLSTAHVRDILAALKVKTSGSTLSIQVNAGRSKDYAGRGEPAPLTAAQVNQLKAVAPDPAIAKAKAEAKAEKPDKQPAKK